MDRKKAQKKDEEGVQKSMASWLPKDATGDSTVWQWRIFITPINWDMKVCLVICVLGFLAKYLLVTEASQAVYGFLNLAYAIAFCF